MQGLIAPPVIEYKLGYEVEHKGSKWLVTRIVDSTAVFQTRKQRYSVTELYVEVVSEEGEVDFVQLRRKKDDLPEPEGTMIKAPEPILWKESDEIGQ